MTASWTDEWIGIPFTERGRNRDAGFDCWGLVRAVYLDRYGEELRSYVNDYQGGASGSDSQREVYELEAQRWEQVDPATLAPGDVLVFRFGRRTHVGIAVDRQRLLHVRHGADSCVERIEAIRRLMELIGAYRLLRPDRS